LQKNRERALQEQLDHLSFVAYGGITFPFEDHCFDLVITRYALHHFPMIEKTFSEIGRVLKPDGHLFLSDPTPNEDDHERFVDAYMQMKKDGHIKFYTKSEWKELADKIHMKLESCFDSEVRFPKKRNTALEFDDLLKKYDHNVIKGYDLSYDEEEIYLTERVNNLLFKR
ncbi:MAG: methyltransferase domain-containing protein, partial [Clostridia bacterium]|nr:methyltransferase domain-containing protein [Clostridia bacterium]